jgi:hypothetical protein
LVCVSIRCPAIDKRISVVMQSSINWQEQS